MLATIWPSIYKLNLTQWIGVSERVQKVLSRWRFRRDPLDTKPIWLLVGMKKPLLWRRWSFLFSNYSSLSDLKSSKSQIHINSIINPISYISFHNQIAYWQYRDRQYFRYRLALTKIIKNLVEESGLYWARSSIESANSLSPFQSNIMLSRQRREYARYSYHDSCF